MGRILIGKKAAGKRICQKATSPYGGDGPEAMKKGATGKDLPRLIHEKNVIRKKGSLPWEGRRCRSGPAPAFFVLS